MANMRGISLMSKYPASFFMKRCYSELSDHQKKVMGRGLPIRRELKNVNKVIAVASCKGGVGKSTTAVNLAIALSQINNAHNVGLLDLDIFGPSIPKMMNLSGKVQINSDNQMVPLHNYGINCMSMGFLINETDPIVMRGPMVMSAIQKLLLNTAWGSLDYLILDLPPGTGDTHLSLSQLITVHGAIIVSTPQKIALLDARKGVEMFRKVNVNILGIVQNMSVYICPHCHTSSHIFGQDGVLNMAAEIGVPHLGDVPLENSIREGSDEGVPVVVHHFDSPEAKAYLKIAKLVHETVQS